MRVHITGASGSGTSTLGAALAAERSMRHLDADGYYWLPTTPPFQTKRDPADRLALLRRDLLSGGDVVLSGSIVGWGAELEDAFDLIVFLYLPAALRVQRLRQREIEHLGQADEAFLRWAAQYDEGPPEGRSLARHQAWLAQRACPVLRLQADESVAQRLDLVRRAWPSQAIRPGA
ncbi:hypothetical protein KAK07_09575 [Ideonella sp. 4Y16]|uniref:hypothetical protein n=1 Tax=Ideonella alba TaxID=2824118 RepID=UPI001B35CA27|nr:hypothetical protein [Ideonella alba]MBQ0943585.1 hypothetical protein [Ideonella alba]